MTAAKKIVYLDMDDVLVNFRSGIDVISADYPGKDPDSHDENWDDIPGIFALMKPVDGAIDAVKRLCASNKLDVYVLSTAPWENATAWSDKLNWIKKHFDSENPVDAKTKDNPLYKKVIISHNKHLNAGEFLVDDRTANGARDFGGFHVHFGPKNLEKGREGRFPDWASVLKHFEELGLLD